MDYKKTFLGNLLPYDLVPPRKKYDNFSEFFDIPNLINIQRQSFQDFVIKGLIQAFNKNNPIILSTSNQHLEI